MPREEGREGERANTVNCLRSGLARSAFATAYETTNLRWPFRRSSIKTLARDLARARSAGEVRIRSREGRARASRFNQDLAGKRATTSFAGTGAMRASARSSERRVYISLLISRSATPARFTAPPDTLGVLSFSRAKKSGRAAPSGGIFKV